MDEVSILKVLRKKARRNRRHHRDDPASILTATVLPLLVAKLDYLKDSEAERDEKEAANLNQSVQPPPEIITTLINDNYEEQQVANYLSSRGQQYLESITTKQANQQNEDENVVWVIAPKENYSFKENVLLSVQSSMPARLLSHPFEYVQNEILK
ncbi:hypothetical protein BDR26DRAFT_672577 [Obelidium mucronatum]|nr:hypothetical protein BDR26DRAFT_672577 [Obelidium mucronatum]